MTINKYEAIGMAASIAIMAIALWLISLETASSVDIDATTNDESEDSLIFIDQDDNQSAAVADALREASDRGSLSKLVIDDVVIGAGDEVQPGDVVAVHYIGSLQNGQQFDNSYTRGQVFTFEVGKGAVIEGWDEGLVGMKVGGKRILVIPSELGYGSRGAGPIPADATLVFAIELVEIQ